MVRDFFDRNELHLAIANLVNRAIASIETNRPLTLAITLQSFVVEAWDFSYLLQSESFDVVNPIEERLNDVLRKRFKLLLGPRRNLNFSNHVPMCTPREGYASSGRLRAAYEACVRPEFTDYEGDDPVGFVVSLNVKRRHLNESQRAMAAAAGIRDGVFGDTQNAANVFRIGLRGVYEAMDILGVERPDEHGRGRPRTDSAPRKERHASD